MQFTASETIQAVRVFAIWSVSTTVYSFCFVRLTDCIGQTITGREKNWYIGLFMAAYVLK